MRVAMLTDLAPDGRPASGVQRATITLITALLDAGVDVRVIANGVFDRDTYPFPIELLEMKGRYQVLRGFRPWIATVSRCLEVLKPDIVHGQGILHHGAAAASYAEALSVVTAHGDPVADAREHYSPAVAAAVTPLLARTVARILRQADAIVDVTPEWQVNLPFEPRSFTFIPNPVEKLFFAETAQPARDRVLFFGGSRHIKGLDILLDAWPQVIAKKPSATLEIYGTLDAPSEQRCAQTASCASHETLDAAGVGRVMRGGGILVVPSRFEVAPLVVPEAWASRLPVVATEVGGVKSLAGDAALLCAPEPRPLATALLRAMEPGHVDRFVHAGSLQVAGHRPDTVAAAHLALYEKVLKTRPGR